MVRKKYYPKQKFEVNIHSSDAGYLEKENGEEVTQYQIKEAIDITSAEKFFELNLDDFGPYNIDYTKNGRFLVLAGQKGHVAAFDWQTKKLLCEMNVMETVSDVKWLHIETMFAVAQKEWTYIYDNQGIELHCLKSLHSVLQLEYLPFHFLLASSNINSYLTWLDVSIGKKVAGFSTGLGRLNVMTQNPTNAILHLGHPGGTVSLWSPNLNEPLVKMLCHGSGTRSIAIDKTGNYMATSGYDRQLKIWDLRTYNVLHSKRLSFAASKLDFSQRGLLAVGLNNIVEVYKDVTKEAIGNCYLSHELQWPGIQDVAFCPYEDILGVGYSHGFSSLLVPGAGEPNFDALEANPYQTKQQRRQAEVKMLLDKIQPDLISLDTSALCKVNVKSLKEKLDERSKQLHLKPRVIDFEPRHRKKGRSKTGKKERRRQGVIEENKKQFIKGSVKQNIAKSAKFNRSRIQSSDVLERFKKKNA